MSGAVRLLHFSDIHLTTRPLGWTLRDLATRRVTGWINWRVLGRRRRFRNSVDVAHAIVLDVIERRPDALVFSGDSSGMGFAREVERCARELRVGDPALPPGIAVPGNHDLYTRVSLRSGAFERAFAPWLAGRRVDGNVYPFARQVGPVWLIGVNSAVPRWRPTDASGQVGPAQRDRLRRLLTELPAGETKVLVTHYPVRLANGQPETHWHGLRDLDETMRVAMDGGVGLWLHGHRHQPYLTLDTPIPAVCAGSVSQSGLASYAEMTIEGRRVTVLRRVFNSNDSLFCDGDRQTFTMPGL